MIRRTTIELATRGRGTYELTRQVAAAVSGAGLRTGLCVLFAQHTSASLVLCENADPDVRRDLEAWLSRAVPDADPLYRHTAEGEDDMPSHVRAVLTGSSLSIPVADGALELGTWQGVYLYEHRRAPHSRRISVTVMGE